jgi:hypothetical protein
MWNGVAFIPTDSSKIVLRVFVTPGASQSTPFQAPLRHCNINNAFYNVEYLTVDMLKCDTHKFSPSDLVDWLLSSHIHFVLTHPNQGQQFWHKDLRWNLAELKCQLLRLYHHNGFPTGIEVHCPIFTQDKYCYLKHLPGYTNKTLQLLLSEQIDETLVRRWCFLEVVVGNMMM